MKRFSGGLRAAFASACLLALSGCGASNAQKAALAEQKAQLKKLREENQEARRLRVENQELSRLRKENQEIQKLQASSQELLHLREENTRLRSQLAAHTASGPATVGPEQSQAPAPRQPIQNLPQAFDEAALLLADQGDVREDDIPQKGDNIILDQNVIGLLIPEFQTNSSGGTYEVSGWLASRGVVIKNYQQLNILGLTNYQIRRVPRELQEKPLK